MPGYRVDAARSGRNQRGVGKLIGLLAITLALLMTGLASPAAAAAPTVSSVSPSKGPLKGGQNVVISGKGFTGASAVKFNDVDATTFAVMSDTKIVAVVPDAPAAVKGLITVTTGGDTNTAGASYEYLAPTVTKIDPAWADPTGPATITITGTGLLGTEAADVKFGTDAATAIWVISDTTIVVTTPVDDTVSDPAVPLDRGVTDVTVTRNSVVSATGDKSKFLFTPGDPTVTFLGTSGDKVTGTDGVAAGSTMTVTGTQLWGVSKINFGSTAVTKSDDITVASDGLSLTVKVPSRSNGPADVTVVNAAGTSVTNLETMFNYYSSAEPKITKVTNAVFDKDDETGGGTMLVTGSGFTGVAKTDVVVKCASDLTTTSAVAVSDTSLIVTIPGSDAAETCDLEIANAIDNTKKVTKADAVRFI